MATSGMDSAVKIWDLRMFKCLQNYRTDHPALSLDFSDKGMLGMAVGRTVQVLRDVANKPADVTYLKHEIRAANPALSSGGSVSASARGLASTISVKCVRFRPFEDLLCAGHSYGLCTMIVPGSGEANFDSFESNPFSNAKQRQETEVQTLLQKLSHEMIGLDAAFVGSVDKDAATLKLEHDAIFHAANEAIMKKVGIKLFSLSFITEEIYQLDEELD